MHYRVVKMRKTDIVKQGLMRISEIAKAAGVSLPTIHYYTREGLLFPSLKTAHNMAYYSPDCVEDIRLIKEFQSKRFLPLSVIKLILQAKRDGQDVKHVSEMESVLGDIFQPMPDETQFVSISLAELISVSGLSETDVNELIAMGVIIASETENGPVFDGIETRIAQIAKRLLTFGLKPADFEIYQQYMEITRSEFKTMHEIIHHLPNHEVIPLRELFKLVSDFKGCLATRIYRQEARHLQEHS